MSKKEKEIEGKIVSDWCKERRELIKREDKAKAYFKKCSKRNKNKKEKYRKRYYHTIITILLVCILSMFLTIVFLCNKDKAKVNENITVENVEKEIEDDAVYIFCNVAEYYEEEVDGYTYTKLICEMPNGELHGYYIEDAPEVDIDLACLRTENQDDYRAYDVVAVE